MAAAMETSAPAAGQPSAAAAAGAAAAALLQRQLGVQDAPRPGGLPNGGWTEHQTGDGRKFYYHEETQTPTWEKPEVLMTPEERANDTKWGEYRIWDGRVFYHNKDTKVSCWRMPPELRKMREGISGIDERPLTLTTSEKRQAFMDLLKDKGIDSSWTWQAADDAVAEEPQAENLTEMTRKQCVGELLSAAMKQRQIDEREKQRGVANALERLIEERFSRPEDVGVTYEEAAGTLGNEEAWQAIKSDVRRCEVFQTVMERLEEKHKKARAEKRVERVVRLSRCIASDPELKRARLRWKDAVAILAKRDELQGEDPPLEALRVWASLRYDLKPATEHDAEARAKVKPDHAGYREDRKRRDAFIALLKELVSKEQYAIDSSFAELQAVADMEPRFAALREGRGATAIELLEEFQEDVRAGRVEIPKAEKEEDVKKEDDDKVEPKPKRQRKGFDPEEQLSDFAAAAQTAAAQAALAVEQRAAAAATSRFKPKEETEEDVSALDALIMGGGKAGAAPAAAGGEEDEDEDDEDDEDDPLMAAVAARA